MSFLPANLTVQQHVPTIRYAVDPVANLVWEEWLGNVSREDLGTHWGRILEEPAVMNCRRTIVDLTNATIDVRGVDLAHMIEWIVKPKLAGRPWITGIVVNSGAQFGLSRQYGAYADLYSTDQIFTTVAGARDWVQGQQHAG